GNPRVRPAEAVVAPSPVYVARTPSQFFQQAPNSRQRPQLWRLRPLPASSALHAPLPSASQGPLAARSPAMPQARAPPIPISAASPVFQLPIRGPILAHSAANSLCPIPATGMHSPAQFPLDSHTVRSPRRAPPSYSSPAAAGDCPS